MKTLTRPRLAVLVFAALALPALTCGVAPALRDLMLRTQQLEKIVAAMQMPPVVLVDDTDQVVGHLLEYNDLRLYTSIAPEPPFIGERSAWSPPESYGFATVLLELDGLPPVVLEANRDELSTPVRGESEEFVFQSDDCSGTPWVQRARTDASLFARAFVAPPGRTLYAAAPDAPPQSPGRFGSRLTVFGGSGVGEEFHHLAPCERLTRFQGQFLPLEPIVDLDARFTPPFRLVSGRDL